MAEKPIVMPKMGESIAEATIIRWLKNEGERVEKDEPIVEIATDKVDSEIPSTEAGILVKQLYQDGDVVKVGEPVAMINTEGGASVSAPVATSAPAATASAAIEAAIPVEAAVAAIEKQIESAQPLAEPMSNDGGSRFYSPLVLNIARAEGISMSQLESLSGTGKEGRVTKADILDFVANRGTGSANAPVSAPVSAPVVATSNSTAVSTQTPAKVEVKSSISLNPGDEIIEMDRVRKMIADHMVMSKHTSPHVTSFVRRMLRTW